MADHRILAQQREEAMGRINAALDTLAKRDKQSYDPMPAPGRDALVSQRDQIVWIADTLERITSNTAQIEVVDAVGPVSVPQDTATSLSFLAETLALDAGLEWETVDFTEGATIDPLSHVEQQLLKTVRAKGLLPEIEGDVTIKNEEADTEPVEQTPAPAKPPAKGKR